MKASGVKTPSAKPADAAEGAQPPTQWWPPIAAIAMLALIYLLLPLGTALELGGDEGYELTKGFLCSKGYVMYKDIWCDQPPVFPMLLGQVFRAVGPSILAARLVTVGFALLLFGAMYQLVRQRSGMVAALTAVLCLLAAPGVLLLSSSVMVEVPAIGTALVSAWLLFQWSKRPHRAWLLASGAVMGLALEIKLTAVMVLPAVLVEIALASWEGGRGLRQRRLLSSALEWIAACGIVFAVVALLWGRGSLGASWRSHTVTQPVPGLSSAADFRFTLDMPLDHLECIIAAAVALVMLGRQKRWRELSFPLVLLLTAVAVHAVHRPWWGYYYLHFAVPLAWLAGLAASELLKGISGCLKTRNSRAASRATWKWVGLCALLALALALAEARLEGTIRAIRRAPRASDSVVLAKMKQYADRTRWVYVQPVIYPFHAGLAVPPELAVVMLKRYWSGQITPEQIVETCRRYKPEQLLLYRSRVGSEWKELLQSSYQTAYQDTNHVLYVSKEILAEGTGRSSERQSPAVAR
jgi:4-amino-4-deoxy-L-arabinose transferase-like glycosyltransferase